MSTSPRRSPLAITALPGQPMSWDPAGLRSSRRHWLALMAAAPVVGLGAGLLAGCSAPQDLVPDPSGSLDSIAARTLRAEQQLADRVVAAVTGGDLATYRSAIGAQDPTFTVTAEQIWRNLALLDLDRLTITVSARREPLVSDRQRLLGIDAAATRATLGWRFAGQRRTVESEIWLTFTGQGDDLRWSGTTDRPYARGRPIPVWWIEPVEVDHTAAVVVIRSASVAAPARASWAALAIASARQATRYLGTRSPDRYVVEVPGSAEGFVAATGQPDAIGLAAVTIPAGPDPTVAPALVVLNPDLLDPATPAGTSTTTTGSPADRLGLTLTHELVHAVLEAPARSAPLWIEEGTADAVAFDADPVLSEAELTRLITGLAGRPPQLPGDAAFVPGSTDLDQTYALAWTACRFVVEERGGWTALLGIGEQLADDPDHAWWLALGLSSLAEYERVWAAWLRSRR